MILGIDIGGTAVKMGLVSEEGEILARHEASVSFDHYRTPILETVLREAKSFLEKEKAAPAGIGVSATGLIDPVSGVVTDSNPMILNWEGSRINETLTEAFGIPVFSLNDADAAAMGEAFAGGARGLREVLLVTVGTGIGGGIITDGRVLLGRDGAAGEIGEMPLFAERDALPSVRQGIFERYASTSALVERVEKATGRTELDGRKICALVRAGDAAVTEVFQAWLRDLCLGIACLINVLNPERVLIGGGISAEPLVMEPLTELVRAHAIPAFMRGLTIEAAQLRNDAGIIGAAKFCMDRMSGSSIE